MNNITRILAAGAAVLAAGCANFDEINTNPQDANAMQTMPYYVLNQSIITAQQNPDTAERLFVINWAAAARQDGEDEYNTSTGEYDDSHLVSIYNYMGNAIKYATDAISLCDLHLSSDELGEHGKAFIGNVRNFARIWKVYLMSEFADSFGPMPIDGFKGFNPEFNSVRDIYYYFYDELREAVAGIDLSVEPTSDEAACDPAYGYDAADWKAYGISLWMRLAMRLSEADNAKARQEFEEAVAAGDGILTEDQTFRVQERPGWDDLTGVMSRTWNRQTLSATVANLMTNLGVPVTDILTDRGGILYSEPDPSRYEDRIKDSGRYLGKRFQNHFSGFSDNPTGQFFFDGLPSVLDPRATVYFFLPGDYGNRKVSGYMDIFTLPTACPVSGMFEQTTVTDAGTGQQKDTVVMIAATETDATFSWNGLPAGWNEDDMLVLNGLVTGQIQRIPDPESESGYTVATTQGYRGTYPQLADEYRNSNNRRVFFGPWETWFLLAEAAVYGWDTGGVTARQAYEAGIKASLDYTGMGAYYDAYIQSTSYNRVGTSVSFTHTEEPSPVDMEYVDGYTGEPGTWRYDYPDPANILYNGHKLNDELTKIITQKYIANMPWLPLENLSDHRRLGLPFWEIPATTRLLPYMPEYSEDSYLSAQKSGYFVQRLPYPSSLRNADPEGYASALEFLGGEDSRTTPLWWAIGGHE